MPGTGPYQGGSDVVRDLGGDRFCAIVCIVLRNLYFLLGAVGNKPLKCREEGSDMTSFTFYKEDFGSCFHSVEVGVRLVG